MITHAIPRSACPTCGEVQERASHAGTDPEPPGPGAVGICWRCGGINLFDAGLRLRAATPAEVEALLASPDGPTIRLYQERIRRPREEHAMPEGPSSQPNPYADLAAALREATIIASAADDLIDLLGDNLAQLREMIYQADAARRALGLGTEGRAPGGDREDEDMA